MMPLAITLSFDAADIATVKLILALAIVSLIGLALYDRWPKWRS